MDTAFLSDISEIPNLRQKATKILQKYGSDWCFGIQQQDDPFCHNAIAGLALHHGGHRLSLGRRHIDHVVFLNKVLEPYGLKVIGQTVAFWPWLAW